MTVLRPPICCECKHLDEDKPGYHCEAFPEGIPSAILEGESNHKIPYPGDKGITFERIPSRRNSL